VRVSASGIADAGAGTEQGRLQVARKTPAELIRPGRSNTDGAIRGKRQCKYGEFLRIFGEFPLFLFTCSLFAVAGRVDGAALPFRLCFRGVNFAGLPPLEAARHFSYGHNEVILRVYTANIPQFCVIVGPILKKSEIFCKNYVKTFGIYEKGCIFALESIRNPTHRGGSRNEKGKDMKHNISELAKANGYGLAVDRHGVYTNYILTNEKGVIRIETDAVKGHVPIVICADHEIEIPENFILFYSDYDKYYTVTQDNNGILDYAKLSDKDIETIIVNNK